MLYVKTIRTHHDPGSIKTAGVLHPTCPQMSTDALSMHPNVSSVEAKGEILQRFSELRWSSDTSPHALRYSAQWWVIDY